MLNFHGVVSVGYAGTYGLHSMLLLCTLKRMHPTLPREQAVKDLEGDLANGVCLHSACSFVGMYDLKFFII